MEEDFLTRQTKEEKRIKKLFKTLPKDRLGIVTKLIERAAYMLVSLEEMEEKITNDGLLVTMPQGAYDIERAHPLLSQYNTMVKNYNTVIKQLTDLLPSSEAAIAGQAIMTFATKPQVKKK